MKKIWPLLFSVTIAICIAVYSKNSSYIKVQNKKLEWRTYVKNSHKEISGHNSTQTELEVARFPIPKREIAQVKNQNDNDDHMNFDDQEKIIKKNNLPTREGRILIGDIQKENYQDEDTTLLMANKINHNWKELLGHELLRFQNDDTKVLIKEEFSIIQIKNGKGKYTEQIIITYIMKDGTTSSYRALVDSETGAIYETWDKSIYERYKNNKIKIPIPTENNSGIITR
jgi:hypothetical protein